MIKSYKAQNFFYGLKFSCKSALKEHKFKLSIIFVCIILAAIAGVVVAVSADVSLPSSCLREVDLDGFFSGAAASSSAFLQRTFSLLVNCGLIFVFSLSSYLFPLAVALFAYRAYLLFLNLSLIFVFYGLGSMFCAVVVILPCQLATLFALVLLSLLLSKKSRICSGTSAWKILLFFVAVLVLLNLLESVLLWLLSGQVLLVI